MTSSETAVVLQAYRYALDPTPRQRGALASHTGASRFAYNWGLELFEQRLEARAAGYEVHVPWSLMELRREWNQAKHAVAPWWAENSKEAYSSGLDGLARALKNWQDSKHGRRAGVRMGFPVRSAKVEVRSPADSPPAPSVSRPTVITSRCPDSAASVRTSPPGNLPGDSSRGGHGS